MTLTVNETRQLMEKLKNFLNEDVKEMCTNCPSPIDTSTLDIDYKAKETVNGVTISVAWDEGYENYTIYFPQIIALRNGVNDQVIRIDNDPKHAEEVFDYASKLALSIKDVYELYKKVRAFIDETY